MCKSNRTRDEVDCELPRQAAMAEPRVVLWLVGTGPCSELRIPLLFVHTGHDLGSFALLGVPFQGVLPPHRPAVAGTNHWEGSSLGPACLHLVWPGRWSGKLWMCCGVCREEQGLGEKNCCTCEWYRPTARGPGEGEEESQQRAAMFLSLLPSSTWRWLTESIAVCFLIISHARSPGLRC